MITQDNPYTPPQTTTDGVPDAPKPFGWEVAGRVVLVRQSSQFPMIDPFTGGTAETMMLQRVEVRHRPRWLSAFPVLGALAMLTLEESGGWNELISLALGGLLLGWLISMFVAVFFPACTLHLFFGKRTLAVRKNAARIMTVLFLIGFFGGFSLSMGPPWVGWIPAIAFLAWLVGLLAGATVVRRLRCHRRSGERFEIRGFHPRALQALAEYGNRVQRAG